MSYIPDCRERFKPVYGPKSNKDEINGYWEGYLNENDKEYINGWDIVADDVTASFFANITDFECLNEIFVSSEIESIGRYACIHRLDSEMPKDAPREVRFLRKLHEELVDWIESERDEMIVSMIDNMEVEEYKAIRAERDKDLPDDIRNLEYNQL